MIYSGRVLKTVLVGIVPGEEAPIPGGVEAELREIFRQLDAILSLAGVDKRAIASVRLYLQEVNRDIAAVNAIYKEYFGSHPPNRQALGGYLQRGMLIEAAVLAELPAAP